MPINVTAFSFVPEERMNNATGRINLARDIGGSVGISLVTTLRARLAQMHRTNLVGHLTLRNPRYLQALRGAAAVAGTHGSAASCAAHQAQGVLYGERVRQSNMLALIDVFWILGNLLRDDPADVFHQVRLSPRSRRSSLTENVFVHVPSDNARLAITLRSVFDCDGPQSTRTACRSKRENSRRSL